MKGGRLMLLLALIPGLLAAALAYKYVSRATRPGPVSVKGIPVVAAKSAIAPRTRITQDLIYVREFPVEAVHPRAALDAEQILGLVTKHQILEGEQIIMDRLYGEDERAGLASSIPADRRAVTVPLNEVAGVAGFVKPGDRVDVIATVSAAGQTGDVALTVLEDVEVLAIAQETEDRTQGKAKVSTSATLAVTPAQAERLALAEEMGDLRLALRPVFASATSGSGAVERDLLGEVRGWVPTKQPSGETAPPSVNTGDRPGQVLAAPAVQALSAPGLPGQGVAAGQMTVEVIKGSQRTYVTLSEQGR